MKKNWTTARTTLFLSLGSFLLSSCSRPAPVAEDVLRQASGLQAEGRSAEAIALLEEYVASHPERLDVLESLAYAYAETADSMMAAITFAQVGDARPAQPEYFLYAADALIAAGDHGGACEYLRRYLQTMPLDVAVWNKLSLHAETAGNLPDALAAARQSHQLQPTAAAALRIGSLHYQAEDEKEARQWYETAISLGGPQAGEALLGLFEIVMRKKAYGEASAIVAQLNREHPLLLESSSLAGLKDELETWEKEQSALRAAAETARLEAERQKAETAARAAAEEALRQEMERERLRLEASREVTVKQPTDGPGPLSTAQPSPIPSRAPPPPIVDPALEKWEEARILVAGGNYEEAARAYRQSLAHDDERAEVWYELAQILEALGNDPFAEAAVLEARRRAPLDVRMELQYLRIAERTQPQDRFLEEVNKARVKFPNQASLTLLLARTYVKLNNPRNAIFLYREFLQQAPGHAEEATARRELQALE